MTCSIAPTGTHKITKSASLTASSAVSKISSQRPIFFAVSRVFLDLAKPVIQPATLFLFDAQKMDEAIRPKPIKATRSYI